MVQKMMRALLSLTTSIPCNTSMLYAKSLHQHCQETLRGTVSRQGIFIAITRYAEHHCLRGESNHSMILVRFFLSRCMNIRLRTYTKVPGSWPRIMTGSTL